MTDITNTFFSYSTLQLKLPKPHVTFLSQIQHLFRQDPDFAVEKGKEKVSYSILVIR